MRRHISGREATHMAIESDKRGPVQIEPMPAEEAGSFLSPSTAPEELVPGSGVAASQASKSRKALALQLRNRRSSESMGNHNSKIVDAGSVD